MAQRRKVLVVGTIREEGMALLAQRDDVVAEVYPGNDPDEIRARVADAHGIVVRTAVIDRAVIDAAPALEVVSRHGVGYDAVDVEALTERGIPLTIAIHGNALAVAEHAMLMLLALAKHALRYDSATREGRFDERNAMDNVELSGRTLLVVGFGRIGSRVAPRALAFGMRVLAYDPYVDPDRVRSAGVEPVDDLAAALARADAVTVHAPLTEETRGMIGAGELALLPPHALVVNTARGGIVDEDALEAALAGGRLGGAGLDVFVGEPTPPRPDHPLFRHDRVLVSPHVAGVTRESTVRMAEGAVRNVLDAFDGTLDPAAVVNPGVLGRGRAG